MSVPAPGKFERPGTLHPREGPVSPGRSRTREAGDGYTLEALESIPRCGLDELGPFSRALQEMGSTADRQPSRNQRPAGTRR